MDMSMRHNTSAIVSKKGGNIPRWCLLNEPFRPPG